MAVSAHECTDCPFVSAGMTRRDFVSHATLAAVAAALSACGGGDGPTSSATSTTPSRPPVISTPVSVVLANFPDLSRVGGVAKVSAQPPIAMARTTAGLVAFSLSCTHEGTEVAVNTAAATLRCPNHGAEFAFDGRWTGGAQTTSSLFSLNVTLDATGTTAAISTG